MTTGDDKKENIPAKRMYPKYMLTGGDLTVNSSLLIEEVPHLAPKLNAVLTPL